MKKIVSFLFIGAVVAGCSSVWEPTPVCPSTNDMVCGSVCCDSSKYVCGNNTCLLVACDSGYYMCHGSCLSVLSMCCVGGGSCFEQQCGSGNTCMPLGSVDCGNSRFCAFGHYCINGGSACQ